MSTVKNYQSLGWHKAHVASPRIAQWLKERQQATIEALSSIPCGKNIGQYMTQRGLFAFAPQIKPKRTQTAIAYQRLEDYEPVLLFLYRNAKSKNNVYALGLVNRRLEVQLMLYQTPEVYVWGSETHPTQFYWKHECQEECIEQINRICQGISETMIGAAQVDFGYGMKPDEMSIFRKRLTPIEFLGTRDRLQGMNIPKYAKFDHLGKKIKDEEELACHQAVKVLMLVDSVSIGNEYGHGFFYSRVHQRIKQVQKMRTSCMFSQINEDEDC